MSSTRAFTLIELVMVIALTGIIAAIALPRYGAAVSRYRVDLAATRIAADLALAQHRARGSGATRTATFHVASDSYRLNSIADFKKPGTDYTIILSQSPCFVSLGSVNFGGDNAIAFNGYGLPDSGGTVTVISGSIQRSITVDAITGGA